MQTWSFVVSLVLGDFLQLVQLIFNAILKPACQKVPQSVHKSSCRVM